MGRFDDFCETNAGSDLCNNSDGSSKVSDQDGQDDSSDQSSDSQTDVANPSSGFQQALEDGQANNTDDQKSDSDNFGSGQKESSDDSEEREEDAKRLEEEKRKQEEAEQQKRADDEKRKQDEEKRLEDERNAAEDAAADDEDDNEDQQNEAQQPNTSMETISTSDAVPQPTQKPTAEAPQQPEPLPSPERQSEPQSQTEPQTTQQPSQEPQKTQEPPRQPEQPEQPRPEEPEPTTSSANLPAQQPPSSSTDLSTSLTSPFPSVEAQQQQITIFDPNVTSTASSASASTATEGGERFPTQLGTLSLPTSLVGGTQTVSLPSSSNRRFTSVTTSAPASSNTAATLESPAEDSDGFSLPLAAQVGIPIAVALSLLAFIWYFRRTCCCKRSKGPRSSFGSDTSFNNMNDALVIQAAGAGKWDMESDVSSVDEKPDILDFGVSTDYGNARSFASPNTYGSAQDYGSVKDYGSRGYGARSQITEATSYLPSEYPTNVTSTTEDRYNNWIGGSTKAALDNDLRSTSSQNRSSFQTGPASTYNPTLFQSDAAEVDDQTLAARSTRYLSSYHVPSNPSQAGPASSIIAPPNSRRLTKSNVRFAPSAKSASTFAPTASVYSAGSKRPVSGGVSSVYSQATGVTAADSEAGRVGDLLLKRGRA